MFSADSTATAVRGVDKLIPVDLYLLAVRPEAIFDAVIKLRKVGDESLAERQHRQISVHDGLPQMKRVEPVVTGSAFVLNPRKLPWLQRPQVRRWPPMPPCLPLLLNLSSHERNPLKRLPPRMKRVLLLPSLVR